MPIRITLDRLLQARRIVAKDLARDVGISETQLSLFRSGKVKGIRFSTLARLCAVLGCKPADLLDYAFHEADLAAPVAEEE